MAAKLSLMGNLPLILVNSMYILSECFSFSSRNFELYGKFNSFDDHEKFPILVIDNGPNPFGWII